MNEIATRAVSGLLYVALLTTAMFFSPLSFYVVIGVFSVLSLWEFQRLINFSSILGPIILISLFSLAYLGLLSEGMIAFMAGWAVALNCFLTYLCLSQKKPSYSFVLKSSFTLFYLICSSVFIPLLMNLSSPKAPFYLLLFYLSIWVNNSFAYLVGSRLGKTKLFPAISPKKSWEGYWGGTIATLVLVYFVENNFLLFGAIWWVIGLLIPLFATLGDFIQSYFKRRANVKDSGTLFPGHGGFYDRMDSVIYTAPFYYLLIKFI